MSQDKEEDAKLKALLKNHVGTAPGDETLKTRTRIKPALGKLLEIFADSSFKKRCRKTNSVWVGIVCDFMFICVHVVYVV